MHSHTLTRLHRFLGHNDIKVMGFNMLAGLSSLYQLFVVVVIVIVVVVVMVVAMVVVVVVVVVMMMMLTCAASQFSMTFVLLRKDSSTIRQI